MTTIGTIGGGSLPPAAQSPVQQVPQGPGVPVPVPVPVPGPVPVPPYEPPVGQLPGMPVPPTLPPNVPPPGLPGQDPWPGPGGQVPMPPTTPPDGPGIPGEPPVPTDPTDPTQPPTGPGKPPTPPPSSGDDFDFDAKPWLIAAGLVGAGALGFLALRTGSRNVEALHATSHAFESGAMHQGGLQSIRDAQLGATFANGIGLGDYLRVATPGINRLGSNADLVAVSRGHLDQAELLAASAALHHTTGDGLVHVDDALRARVLDELKSGRSMPDVLADLDRSADGIRPAFDNPQLARYWDQASIVETGPRQHGQQVTSAERVVRPRLELQDREIVEAGGEVRINQLVAERDSRLGYGDGLPEGIGSIQAANVSTLPPALRQRALEASGVDPVRVEELGLRGAYMERWDGRIVS